METRENNEITLAQVLEMWYDFWQAEIAKLEYGNDRNTNRRMETK